MKTPLIYQQTEYDCGEVAIKNALSCLYEREEMPLELVYILSSYSVACYGEDGELLDNSFSKNILFFVASWIRDYAKEKHISLSSKYLAKSEVNLLTIKKSILSGGVLVFKAIKRKPHFITITGIDDEFVYIFDPMYSENLNLSNIVIVEDRPFKYNRKITISEFVKDKRNGLTLGVEANREALVLIRNNAILQREFN